MGADTEEAFVDQERTFDRRTVICAGVAGLVVAGNLSACGFAGDSGAASTADPMQNPASGAPTGGGAAVGQADGIAAASLEVGGFTTAKTPDGKPVIVTRPAQDKVLAFSAVCTHQGCQVVPSGERLSCPCHGSQFDLHSGEVLSGPAKRPLPRVAARLQGQQIVLG
jgi:Rieske Fe-S protein